MQTQQVSKGPMAVPPRSRAEMPHGDRLFCISRDGWARIGFLQIALDVEIHPSLGGDDGLHL